MKKLLLLILSCVLLLNLCACGGTPAVNDNTTDVAQSSDSDLLSIGDTAQGSVCSVTATSVEFVDKIADGYLRDVTSPSKEQIYQDVTAEDGYSIVKVSYHFDYTGKEAGAYTVKFTLNYDDGYTFNGHGGHALPAIDNGRKVGSGFVEQYTFNKAALFQVDDPLEFHGTNASTYIFVNDAVKTNTDKSYVLEVGIPSAPNPIVVADANGIPTTTAETPELEVFTYNLR